MFYCKNMIEHSEVFQLNFADINVVTDVMDKLVPNVDSNFYDITFNY